MPRNNGAPFKLQDARSSGRPGPIQSPDPIDPGSQFRGRFSLASLKTILMACEQKIALFLKIIFIFVTQITD